MNIPFSPRVSSSQQVELCVQNRGRYSFQVGGKPGVGISFRYPTATRYTWL